MPNRQQKLIEYLKEVAGDVPKIESLPDTTLKRIPFFLRDNYTLELITIMGHRFVVANAKGKVEIKPGQIVAHADLLRKTQENDIAFVFPLLPAYLRQRLVQKGVAFIVPGIHLFLPFMAMDFRTRTRTTIYAQGDAEGPLSMPSQMVVLYHLQRQPLGEHTLGQLSKQFNYSAMTLSRVIAELTRREICEAQRDGVRKHLRFVAAGRGLWQKVSPYFQSPVMATKMARIDKNMKAHFLHAGITALSEYTMLADDPVPAVAIFNPDWRRALKESKITDLPYPDETGACVEVWGYDPKLLAEPGSSTVDRLSLYLSCKDNQDERVQSALEKLLEDVQWSKG